MIKHAKKTSVFFFRYLLRGKRPRSHLAIFCVVMIEVTLFKGIFISLPAYFFSIGLFIF